MAENSCRPTTYAPIGIYSDIGLIIMNKLFYLGSLRLLLPTRDLIGL